ncbi:MAG: EAL domain-containing protein [Pseudomonadota bacterium]
MKGLGTAPTPSNAVKPGGRATVALGIDNLSTLEELFGDEVRTALLDKVRAIFEQHVPQSVVMRQTQHNRFLLDMPGMDEQAVEHLVVTLQQAAARDAVPTTYGPVSVTISAGCAFVEPDALDHTHEASALHALHAGMADGVGAYRVARDDAALIAYRTRLMQASQAAMGEQDLALAFQPVVRAEGSNVISFHECLVRIRKPDGGVLKAASFMPTIERLGLAPLIDRQVLMMTFEQLTLHPLARFSINIFSHTMQDRQWMLLFENAVCSDPTLAERLIVEVTERAALLDLGRTGDFMDRLRDYGVTFALDDFGAGHTSLRYLRDLRFDILKIDGRFIRDVNEDDDNAFLVETMVRIAQRFDMMSVAEAVQTPAEARCLSDLGVEFFQGFQFGSPSLILQPTPTPMPSVAVQA